MRGASIRDGALLFHRLSTAFKAPIMVFVSKIKVCTFNYIQINHQLSTSCAKSNNCIGKEPVSSKITRLSSPSFYTQYIQYI